MFLFATAFNQPGIKVWNIQETANMDSIVYRSGLPNTFVFDSRPNG